jgi:hypothetical protein
MSRYTSKDGQGRLVVYGFDHALGYYFDIYPGDDEEEEPVEQQSWFTGLTGGKMMDEFGRRGIKVPEDHWHAAAGDDPF